MLDMFCVGTVAGLVVWQIDELRPVVVIAAGLFFYIRIVKEL